MDFPFLRYRKINISIKNPDLSVKIKNRECPAKFYHTVHWKRENLRYKKINISVKNLEVSIKIKN